MLAAFTPNPPGPCNGNNGPPNFTPVVTNVVLATGVPVSLLFNTNHNPDSFGASFLPAGLSINTTNGNITGAPTDPGGFTITLTATNECGTGTGTLNLLIEGFSSPDSTPWPVNLARKGTLAFADLTALPSAPTTAQINKLMGWRNYATTQQTGASFNSPSFPNDLAHTEYYARYFLGAIPPFTTPFTTVPHCGPNTADGPGGDDSAGINKASKNDWVPPEPAPVPRNIFARIQSASRLLARAQRCIIRRKVGHE